MTKCNLLLLKLEIKFFLISLYKDNFNKSIIKCILNMQKRGVEK